MKLGICRIEALKTVLAAIWNEHVLYIDRFLYIRASDFLQDWWAEVTHEATNGGSFYEMMGPSILN